jgi:TP901 family phage tail tape measure protein
MADRLATLEVAIIGKISDFVSKMDAADKRIDTFQSKTAALGSSFSKAGASMAILGAAVAAPLGLMSREVIKTGATFEQTMRNVQSVLGVTGAQGQQTYETLSAFAQKMGRTTVFQATEAANAMYFLASAGYDAGQQMAALKPILDLAAATQADLASSSEIVVSTLNAFRLEANQAGRVANVFAAGISKSQLTMERLGVAMPYIAAVAKNLNINLEETVGTLGVLVSSGIRAESAGSKLRTTLLQLASPTKKARQALEEMGMSAEDVDPSMVSLTDIIDKFAKAGLTAAQASDIFGARGTEIWLTLTSQGADRVRELTEEITGTAASSEMAAIQLDSVAGAMKLLRSAIQGIEIIIFDAIRDDLKRVIDIAQRAAEAMGNFAEKHQTAIKWITRLGIVLGGAIASIGVFGGAFLILGGQVLNTISHLDEFIRLGKVLRGVLTGISVKLITIVGLLAALAIGLEIGDYLNQWDTFRTAVQRVLAALSYAFDIVAKVEAIFGDEQAKQKLEAYWSIASGVDPVTGQPFGARTVRNMSLVDAAISEIENMFYRIGEAADSALSKIDETGKAVADLADIPEPEMPEILGPLPAPAAPKVPGATGLSDEDLEREAAARRAILERRGMQQELYDLTLAQRQRLLEAYGTEQDFLANATVDELERYNALEERLLRYQDALADDTSWRGFISNARRASVAADLALSTIGDAAANLGNIVGNTIVKAFDKAGNAVVSFFGRLLADLASAIARALVLATILSAFGLAGGQTFGQLFKGALTGHFQDVRPDWWARGEGGRILDLFAQGMQREVPQMSGVTGAEGEADGLGEGGAGARFKIVVENPSPMTKVRVYDEWFEERARELSEMTTEAD